MPVVAASGLQKNYGPQTVVHRLDLTLEAGTCHGLLGPNDVNLRGAVWKQLSMTTK